MPRARRGGARQGTPGKPYPNRSDLRQPKVAIPGQAYGVQKQQLQAQAILPVSPSPGAAPVAGGPPVASTPGGPPPGSFGPLDRPTDNPSEPLTAGIPMGAGPGPEALMLQGANPVIQQIKALYAAFPDDSIREILEDLELEGLPPRSYGGP